VALPLASTPAPDLPLQTTKLVCLSVKRALSITLIMLLAIEHTLAQCRSHTVPKGHYCCCEVRAIVRKLHTLHRQFYQLYMVVTTEEQQRVMWCPQLSLNFAALRRSQLAGESFYQLNSRKALLMLEQQRPVVSDDKGTL
jgi:hypothetical protein